MTKIELDKREIKLEGNKVIVTRTTTESYDAEEYLRSIARLEQQNEATDLQKEEINVILKDLKGVEKEVVAIREKEIEIANKQREEYMKKMGGTIEKKNVVVGDKEDTKIDERKKPVDQETPTSK